MLTGTLPLAFSILDTVSHANFAGQCILLSLALFSIIAWTLMIGKHLEIKRIRTLNNALLGHLQKAPSPAHVRTESNAVPHCPYSQVLATAQTTNTGAPMEAALQRDIASIVAQYESKMSFLSSIISGAPYIGLLGTVWGVMDAFASMAAQGSSSLQTLAPGVSGALLTTVAALLVAIPSVFGYNFLVSRVKRLTLDLENFASELFDTFSPQR